MRDQLTPASRIIVADWRSEKRTWLAGLLQAQGYSVVEVGLASDLFTTHEVEPAALIILGPLPTWQESRDTLITLTDTSRAPQVMLALDAPPGEQWELDTGQLRVADYFLITDPEPIIINRIARVVVETVVAASVPPVSTDVALLELNAGGSAADEENQQRALAEALRDIAAALTTTLDPDAVLGLILE